MEGGIVIDVMETEAMITEIQGVTKQRFDLSMSALITVSLLQEKLRFLLDMDFAWSLLKGDVHVPVLSVKCCRRTKNKEWCFLCKWR
jgi:hypothetical protein